MTDIYGSAELVMVWLRDEDDHTSQALERGMLAALPVESLMSINPQDMEKLVAVSAILADNVTPRHWLVCQPFCREPGSTASEGIVVAWEITVLSADRRLRAQICSLSERRSHLYINFGSGFPIS